MDVRTKSIAGLVISAFWWGTTFILVKETVAIVPLDGFLSVRFILASLILFALALPRSEARKELRKKASWFYGILLGSILFASYWFQTEGLAITTPAKAAFITGLSVVLVPIFGIYPFRTKVIWYEWFSVLLAFLGLAFVTLDFNNISNINLGDLLILVTAVSVAYHILITPYAEKVDTYLLVAIQMLTIGILSTVTAIARGTLWFPTNEPPVVWLTIFVTSVLASAFAFVAQTYAQKNGISQTNVALIFALEPVFALLIDIFIGIIPNFQVIIGMVLILVGMIITSFALKLKSEP